MLGMLAVTAQEIEIYSPEIWVVWLAMLLPAIRQALAMVIPGADTSARKAAMAVTLSVLLGVVEALADGRPDTFNSIMTVAIGIATVQFVSYEIFLKRLLKRMVGELEVPTESQGDPLDLVVDGD